jgi:hypothetical protein
MEIQRIDNDKKHNFPIGTVLWFRGYGKDGERFAVIKDMPRGGQYVASIETYRLSDIYPNTVGPWEKLTGIGYYLPPEEKREVLPLEQVEQIAIMAYDKRELEAQEREKKAKMAEEAKQKGKEWIDANCPPLATHGIVAKLERRTSDIGEDYVSTTTDRMILLGYSKNGRLNFNELKKAAILTPETMLYAPDKELREHLFAKAKADGAELVGIGHTGTDNYIKIYEHEGKSIYTDYTKGSKLYFSGTPDNEDSLFMSPVSEVYMDMAKQEVESGKSSNPYYQQLVQADLDTIDAALKVINHKVRGHWLKLPSADASGYEVRSSENYLGENVSSGWRVEKIDLRDTDLHFHLSKPENRAVPEVKAERSKDATQSIGRLERPGIDSPDIIAISLTSPNPHLEIIPYSEKSFVLTGEGTKAIKDTLKEMGGGFGTRFTHPTTSEKFAGWVFSNKHLSAVKAIVEHIQSVSENMAVQPIIGVNDHLVGIGKDTEDKAIEMSITR